MICHVFGELGENNGITKGSTLVSVSTDMVEKIISGDAVCYDDVIKRKHFPRYWPFVI